MKLTIKSLTGTNFTLDAEPSDTIGSVKAKIEAAQGHAASSQKLIFSGKILTDDQTIEKCNIKSEKDFLVCMVSKPKAPKPEATAAAVPSTPAPAAASVSTPAAPAPATSAAPPATPATPSPASSAPATAPAAPAAGAATSGPSSSFLSGAALESAIANMEEMGFAKPEIQRAMRASFNNPDRAIEYLMTGIPEGLGDAPAAGGAAPTSTTPASTTTSTTTTSSTPAVAPAAAAPAAAPAARTGNLFEAAAAAAQGGGAAGAGATGAAGGRGGIPGVEEDGQGGQTIDLGNPQMVEQLRTLLAQNPTALQPLIQAIAQSNPQLAQAMAQDPEGVLEMLAQGAEGGAGAEGEALPSFEELSEEDRTAVQNISAMGIPVDQAIECYLMCGRNVEMAVQYYFDNPGDFQ